MLTEKKFHQIFRAIAYTPKECAECVAFHEEGTLAVPCRGDFHPKTCELSKGYIEAEEVE